MNKTGKIILLALGVILAALSVAGLASIPGKQEAVGSAVYLEEPVLLAENEGKRVILHGRVEMTGPAHDPELGLTLQTPKAYRYNEQYQRTAVEGDEETYEWVSRGTATITGAAKVGQFQLSNELLIMLPATKVYDDFDPEEASRWFVWSAAGGTETYVIEPEHLYYDKHTYATNGLANREGYQQARERDGARAWRYRVFDPETAGEMTLSGVQQNGFLVRDDAFSAIYEGVKSREEFLSTGVIQTAAGSGVFLLIGLVMIFLALRKPKTNNGKKVEA